MKTLTVKFCIELDSATIESDEYGYEYSEHDNDYPYKVDDIEYNENDFLNIVSYEDVLGQMENDKIEWVFSTLSIRHQIISNE